MTTRSLALLLALAAAGCSRKEPSPEFTRASERFNKLYAQKLDDAYVDPAIREVEALLERVPADSLDAQAASQLLTRIRDGRSRLETATREREKALAEARTPPKFSGGSVTAPPVSPPPVAARPASPPDAGTTPLAPSAGMSTREFNRLFGDCFEPAGPVEVSGRGTRDSFTLVDSGRCRTSLPSMANSVVLADSQTVLGVVPKSALRQEPVDGGTPAPRDAGG